MSAGERGAVEPAGALEAAGEAHRARLEAVALVIGGDHRARGLLDRGVDRADLVLLDDIVAQRRGDHPDQSVLELGGKLDLAQHRLLEAVEAAAAGDHQLHRLGGDRLVGVADQREQHILACGGRVRPVQKRCSSTRRTRTVLSSASRSAWARSRIGSGDRDMGRGQSGVERLVRREPDGEPGAQIVLDRADQAGQQGARR